MELLQENIVIAITVLSPIIAFLVNPLKKVEKLDNNLLPYVSMTIGVAFGVVFALVFNLDLSTYGLGGLISGATASGFYDAFMATKGGE